MALCTAAFVLALGATSLRADDAPPEHTGVKIGDKAPDFTLTDQTGKMQSLSDLLKNGSVALVFIRSADW
jgi:cytochrome oxidase Cu insertion factor (SCO1/SenC/PrrC family)